MRWGEIIQFQLWNHVMKALQHPTCGIVPKNQNHMADAISNSKKKSTMRHCQPDAALASVELIKHQTLSKVSRIRKRSKRQRQLHKILTTWYHEVGF